MYKIVYANRMKKDVRLMKKRSNKDVRRARSAYNKYVFCDFNENV